MENEVSTMLVEEIKRDIGVLATMSPESEEYSKATDSLAKLYKLKIEEAARENDVCVREFDEACKMDEMSERAKDRYFRLGIDAAAILVPIIFYAVWMRRGFKFEETGTFTSTTFRGLFNNFKPTKR